MPLLTLGQAAKETGKQKSTILEAIRAGRLSAKRDDKNQWQIDPAELFRVYDAQHPTERHETPPNTQPNTLETPAELSRMLLKEREERERERHLLEGTIEDLRTDRDHWRQQATALLTHQPEPASVRATHPTVRPVFWVLLAAALIALSAWLAAEHWGIRRPF